MSMYEAPSKEVAQSWATDMRAKGYAKVHVKKVGGFWKVVWSRRLTPRSNPTKAQKRVRAASTRKKAATERRVASALAKYLRVQNPGQKSSGAKIQKLNGGVIKITPIRSTGGRK
jgi:hypothetical protein